MAKSAAKHGVVPTNFILFSEGPTEHMSLPGFLKRWLDPRLGRPVGIRSVNFGGWPKFVKSAASKAKLHLRNPKNIAVIGLLDLYGPTIYPNELTSANSRYDWAKKELERQVGEEKYHQFFAVHEVEAWPLSDPSLFPAKISKKLLSSGKHPEEINTTKPPAKLLEELYWSITHRAYKKNTHGPALFQKLDPNIAYKECPSLKSMLDCMLTLAKEHLS